MNRALLVIGVSGIVALASAVPAHAQQTGPAPSSAVTSHLREHSKAKAAVSRDRAAVKRARGDSAKASAMARTSMKAATAGGANAGVVTPLPPPPRAKLPKK